MIAPSNCRTLIKRKLAGQAGDFFRNNSLQLIVILQTCFIFNPATILIGGALLPIFPI